MEISHPRRLLVLSAPNVDIAPIINILVPPPPASGPESAIGSKDDINPDPEALYHIQTPYYSAHVPIWTDRIESSTTWISEWKSMDGAAEVVRAIGGWVVGFEKPTGRDSENAVKKMLSDVSGVISHHASSTSYDANLDAGDTIMLAVALRPNAGSAFGFNMIDWEDACRDCGGWELIDAEASGAKNEYGETTGLGRLTEALESGEWDSGLLDVDEMLDIGDDEVAYVDGGPSTKLPKSLTTDEDGLLDHEKGLASEAGMLAPILPSKAAKKNEGEGYEESDDDVEQLQRMMIRMHAARDMGADLPVSERRKLAAKAVQEVMRDA